MAKFKVLRAIELDGKLYLPASDNPPAKARSASNGQIIPVDASGVIELTDAQAKELILGQIQAIGTQQSAVSKQKAEGKKQKAE
jgi:hypothetical protein